VSRVLVSKIACCWVQKVEVASFTRRGEGTKVSLVSLPLPLNVVSKQWLPWLWNLVNVSFAS